MEKTKIIETKSGNVQGYIENKIHVFKGIPYAEPPINDLRFQAPVDKTSWEGVREAIEYGPAEFQGYTELEDWMGKPPVESEDCLYLNIWTPGTDNKKRPVMVWIHGGAFIIGTGNDPAYDGSALAGRGDLVIVTINYRLGVFGFLYIPDKMVNIGSLDQIKALEWVRDNIERFGGDPNNVTIFGESAGGYSVVSLCSMPGAKGLFHRVIAESAPTIDPAVSDKSSKKILRKLNIKAGDLDALRKVPPEKIIEVQNEVFAGDPTNIMALRPLISETFPIHPQKAFQKGDCANLDFMIGTNLDEFKLFSAMAVLKKLIEAGAEKLLIGFLGMAGIPPDRIHTLLDTYKEARKGKYSTEPMEIFNAIVNDYAFRISTTRLLEAQNIHQPNTYNYIFTWPSPAFNGTLGTCHALEIPFVFGNLNSPTFKQFVEGAPKALSEKMMDSWIAFARTGNPNHAAIPKWPAYNSNTRATMFFGTECKVVNAAFEKERKAWDGLLKI